MPIACTRSQQQGLPKEGSCRQRRVKKNGTLWLAGVQIYCWREDDLHVSDCRLMATLRSEMFALMSLSSCSQGKELVFVQGQQLDGKQGPLFKSFISIELTSDKHHVLCLVCPQYQYLQFCNSRIRLVFEFEALPASSASIRGSATPLEPS